MRMLAISGVISLALASTPALAQVYKWVDVSGKVNYGDRPPPETKGARALDEESGLVSVVPGMAKDELLRLNERSERLRVQQLEREVDALRSREQARAGAVPEIVYAENVVPVYAAYPRSSRRWPAAGHPGRWPNHPADRHKPSLRPRPPMP